MSTNRRTVLSLSIGFAIAAFTLAAAIVAGPAASITLASFYTLAIYGVAQITIISYAPPARGYRRVSGRPVSLTAGTSRPTASGHATPIHAAIAIR